MEADFCLLANLRGLLCSQIQAPAIALHLPHHCRIAGEPPMLQLLRFPYGEIIRAGVSTPASVFFGPPVRGWSCALGPP